MLDSYHVFLSYSRNDVDAAVELRTQLDRQGFSVFRDAEDIRQGDGWLERLQQAVDACGSFVVLIGRDGVARWISAETQVALNRHFGVHDATKRLPIFPILLRDTLPDTLPAFLRLFQATSWNGFDPLPVQLLDQIRDRTLIAINALAFEGCPFVGLNSYRVDQAPLFFGRQQDTLKALACFDTRAGHDIVRWLEINGNSGSGKSSLMNAGLLPLIDNGWLWPRTGYAHWQRIGTKTGGERPVVTPMVPGQHPVRMLAEQLAVTFSKEMTDVRMLLEQGNDDALAEWLRSRKQADTAFLLAIDQFEELFTFSDAAERIRFDRLLATALVDVDCPLFVISTVRADFLDRFESDLPSLNSLRRGPGRSWPLPLLDETGLREVIDGPARLAGLDVSAVMEAMLIEARDEPGALPLVENALHWLWENRERDPQSGKMRLSGRQFTAHGGLAGILSSNADDLLKSLGDQREQALDLLFRLVKVDPEGRRHSRRRIPLAEAIDLGGGVVRGHELVSRLAGERARDGGRHGPLRLITVTEELVSDTAAQAKARWVNLIHETLIRCKGPAAEGKLQPYWPTLWQYIEQHRAQAARRERLQLQAQEWNHSEGFAKLWGLAGLVDLLRSGWKNASTSIERRYLRWSMVRAAVWIFVLLLGAVAGSFVVEGVLWANTYEMPAAAIAKHWKYKLGVRPPLPELREIPTKEFQVAGNTLGLTTPVYFGATEVTFDQFDAFVIINSNKALKLPLEQFGRGEMPVIKVTWKEADAYAKWLGTWTVDGKACRLPSEAEWEYACRAGSNTNFALPAPDGSNDITNKELANCSDCAPKRSAGTTPVRTFKPNGWNLFDMHGNVWEWTSDCAQTSNESCERPLRGGSWDNLANGAKDTNNSRCSSRQVGFPNFSSNSLGFRVVCASPIP